MHLTEHGTIGVGIVFVRRRFGIAICRPTLERCVPIRVVVSEHRATVLIRVGIFVFAQVYGEDASTNAKVVPATPTLNDDVPYGW